jgi:hypothetical protein
VPNDESIQTALKALKKSSIFRTNWYFKPGKRTNILLTNRSKITLSYTYIIYPILSYPILSYPILSYPILSYTILSYPILSYTIQKIEVWHIPNIFKQSLRLKNIG